MIRRVNFDGAVVIPGGADYGAGAPRGDLRDQSFDAADGWDIREVLPGVFSLNREGMPAPVTVGGYPYSVVRGPDPVVRVTAVGPTDGADPDNTVIIGEHPLASEPSVFVKPGGSVEEKLVGTLKPRFEAEARKKGKR